MTRSRATILAAALLGAAAPALAQYAQPRPAQPAQPQQPAAPAQPQRDYNLSRDERTALQPALTAANAEDWAAAAAALPAADAAARGADAKYVIAQIRLRIGLRTNDVPLQTRAIDDLIASGGAQPQEMAGLYESQARLALQAGNQAKAEQALARLATLNPNDPNLLINQAQLRIQRQDFAGALQLYQQAAQRQQAANQPIPPEWRRQIAGLSYRARQPQAVGYMRELVQAAPTTANWHDALVIYRELSGADAALQLDIYRLMRAANVLTGENDYVTLAEAANGVRAFGEVKAVLEQGRQRNVFTSNAAWAQERLTVATNRAAGDRESLAGERTTTLAGSDAGAALRLGDAYYGYADFRSAAELYRAALSKGADAGLANIRLGAALAQAGDRAGAEAAFRAVTGPRAELAQFWLLYLTTPPRP